MDANAALEEDLCRLAEQEHLLRLDRFGPTEAWALGNALRNIALARGGPLAIDVSLRDRVLFHCALPGSTTGRTPEPQHGVALAADPFGLVPTRSADRWRCQVGR